jgi:hypothetical protein
MSNATCLYPIDPTAFEHDPGGALLKMGQAATELWERAKALPRGDPLRVQHLQAAISMRRTERNGWLAVRTSEFPAGDLAGAAQAALALAAYYSDLDDNASAREFVLRAVAEAPAGTHAAWAAAVSKGMNGW